jgi:hypothetical protein
MATPNAKAFISHSKQETDIALELRQRLEANGLQSFAYEKDIPFGATFPDEIRADIERCDHFVLILSDASRESEWVARELGLALELLQSRGRRRQPTIVGVRCGSPCSSFVFPVRQFATSELLEPPYDFTTRRQFDLTKQGAHDEFDDFVTALTPAVTIVSSLEDFANDELLQDSLDCYVELFPDEDERDLPSDIVAWIEESRRAGSDTPWREVYAILHIGDYVIGMAFLTAHVESHWCFGNYFGVRAGYRQGNRANRFYQEIASFLLGRVDPQQRGILFEVEQIDFAALAAAARLQTIRGSPDRETVLKSLRRLRRLLLYQSSQARAFLGSDRQPLRYRQPAMEETLNPESEVPLILMTRLLPGVPEGNIQLPEVLNFIYDDLYGDAYGGPGNISIPGYGAYLRRIKEDVAASSRGWSLGNVPIDRATRGLIDIAKKEGLEPELNL